MAATNKRRGVAFLKASVYGCLCLVPAEYLRFRAKGMALVPRGASCQGDVPLRTRSQTCAGVARLFQFANFVL